MQAAPQPTPRPTGDATRTIVEETIAALYLELHHKRPPSAILDPRSRLDADLGFDSVARVELLDRLERTLQTEIPQTGLASLDTIGDLLKVASSTPNVSPPDRELAPAASRLRSTLQRESSGDEPTEAATLPEVLAWRASRAPQSTHAIVLGDAEPRVLTYQALLEGAQAIASGIGALGLRAGATAALMLPTSADYLYAFFGVLLAGATPVPLYPPARWSQLEEHVQRHTGILSNAGTEILITFRAAAPLGHLLKARVPALRHVISVSDLTERAHAVQPASGPRADSIALLQYTSGSTGSPKGVVLTHEHLLANIRAMGAAIRASDEDVMVSWLPLYHDMGLIGAWLSSIYFGCPLVLMPPTTFLAAPVRWLRAIHRYRGTLSGSPNFGYELATRRITDEQLRGVDLSSLRATFNGAEAVSPDTLERFRRRFAPYGCRPEAMMPVYGLAEAGVGVAFPPLDRGPLVDRIARDRLAIRGQACPVATDAANATSFVSCGRPLPGYRLRIVDERGTELPERTEGNLQFTGPSATGGYYRNAEATAALLCGEWRNTGDRAYLAGGELYVTGRAKDMIIRHGRHIYPEELESAVGAIEGIRKGCVAAFGVRNDETGTERLVVLAETRETDSARRSELQRRTAECVAASVGEPADEIVLAAPHTVLKTSSGKLRRAATRQAYADGSLGRMSRNPAVQWLRLALESLRVSGRRPLHSVTRLAFGFYAWCAALAIAGLAFARMTPVRDANRIWRLNHSAARRLVHALRIPMEVTWEQKFDARLPHIIVANHSSYFDSILLSALLTERHRFVAKAELAQVPVLGRFLRKLRTLFVERSSPERSGAGVDRFRQALADGDPLVIFPEGTFTATTGLRVFHLGAFRAAVAADVPVIPLALCGSRSVFREGQWLPRRIPVRAVIGAPLTPTRGEERLAAAVRLRDAARAHILRHCGEPDLTVTEFTDMSVVGP